MSGTDDVHRTISRVIVAIVFTFMFYLTYVAPAEISDLKLCGDKNCEKVISIARAIARYKQMDPIFLSFERGDDVQILSKSAGKNLEMWSGQVNGRKGYFPRSFVREYEVKIPNPSHELPTEQHIPLEKKIVGMYQNEEPAGRDSDVVVDNSRQQAKETVEDVKKDDKSQSDSDQADGKASKDDTEVDETDIEEEEEDEDDFTKELDNFDRELEKSEDDTEISEEDDSKDANDEKDEPETESQVQKVAKDQNVDKSPQEVQQETKDEAALDFDAKRKVNVLKHLNDLDQNLTPFLEKKDEEKAKVEELKKMLEARHGENDETDIKEQTVQDTTHISEGKTEKDDTEIDESEDDEKKIETKPSTQEEERKEERKETDDTEISDEQDGTEVDEEVEDTKTKIEPLVHDDIDKVITDKPVDSKAKQSVENVERDMKDMVQAQVEQAIKQVDIEHKEDVKEMQQDDSATKEIDPTEGVVKDVVEEGKKNIKEVQESSETETLTAKQSGVDKDSSGRDAIPDGRTLEGQQYPREERQRDKEQQQSLKFVGKVGEEKGSVNVPSQKQENVVHQGSSSTVGEDGVDKMQMKDKESAKTFLSDSDINEIKEYVGMQHQGINVQKSDEKNQTSETQGQDVSNADGQTALKMEQDVQTSIENEKIGKTQDSGDKVDGNKPEVDNLSPKSDDTSVSSEQIKTESQEESGTGQQLLNEQLSDPATTKQQVVSDGSTDRNLAQDQKEQHKDSAGGKDQAEHQIPLTESSQSESADERQHQPQTASQSKPVDEQHQSQQSSLGKTASEQHQPQRSSQDKPPGEQHQPQQSSQGMPVGEQHQPQQSSQGMPVGEQHQPQQSPQDMPVGEQHQPQRSSQDKPPGEQHQPQQSSQGMPVGEQHQPQQSQQDMPVGEQHQPQTASQSKSANEQHQLPQGSLQDKPPGEQHQPKQSSQGMQSKPANEQHQPPQSSQGKTPGEPKDHVPLTEPVADAMRQKESPVVEKELLPSQDSVSLETAEPGFTVIDGTPFPLDMFEETDPVKIPAETPELKMRMTNEVITESTSVPDIQASKTLTEEQNTEETTHDMRKDDMQVSHHQSQIVASPRIEDVHSTIQESLAQHPSFTSSDADGLLSSETKSLPDTASLHTGATEDTAGEKQSTEKFQHSVSLSEQLVSSMGVAVADKDAGSLSSEPSTQPEQNPQLQSESLTRNNTDNEPKETKPPEPSVNQDIYATSADFIARKPLSHDGNFGRVHEDNSKQNEGQTGDRTNEDKKPLHPLENTVTSNEPLKEPGQNTENTVETTTSSSIDQQEAPKVVTPVDQQEIPEVVTHVDQGEPPKGVTPAPVESNAEIPPPPVDKPTAVVEPWREDVPAPDGTQEPSAKLSGQQGGSEFIGDKAVDDGSQGSGIYDTDSAPGRKINDDGLEAKEDKIYLEEHSWSKSLDTKLSNLILKLPPSVQSLLEQEPLGLTPQMTVLVTIVTLMMFGILSCCTLCCGSKKPKKKDPVLVVRGLEEQLFIMTKEKENLEDELLNTQKKMKDMEKSLVTQESSSGELETDLQNYKLHNDVLKTNIATLQQEVLELRQDLTDQKNDGKAKQEKLSNLQKEIKQKDKQMTSKQESLDKANKNISESLAEIASLNSQVQSMTDQVKHLETRKQQLIQETDGWNEKVQDLTERLEQSLTGQKQMQEDLAFKENELEVLRDCFLQLKAFETEDLDGQEVDSSSVQEKFQSMMDVSRVKATLRAAEEEKDTIQNKLDIETQCREDMEEQIASLQAKVETYQADKMKAERQSHEYQTKLNVLSHYFKEKELQLQRELGEHEALKKQNIDRLEHADERSKMVETELQTYRSQVEDLKAEILSAERDFRSQIAANEKKAHENWLAARAAERELKETKHESSVLRQKLTDLERRLLHGPSGLIRPLPTRLPPPGMNGPPPPPPPGMERPGSRGGAPGLRDDEFRDSPGLERMPPPGPPHDRRLPPGPMGPGGPRMPPPPPLMDGRSPPPYDRRPPPPMDRRSPPPYERGLRMPPPPMDRRSPGYRLPPPDMIPRMRGPPPPPHGLPNSPPPPPMGMGLPDSRQGLGAPRYRPPPEPEQRSRQQSQV